MNSPRLLSSAALYGLADIAVMAVGGFLLLPLYTRSLTQVEFGYFVAVRANIDIFSYVLQFGLPSAMARLYFDFKKVGSERQYVSAIVCLFALLLLGVSAVLAIAGPQIWELLSPSVPLMPYLPLSVGIAAIGCLSGISIVWLRVEARPIPVVALQLGGSVLVAIVASVALGVFHLGLTGILLALIAGSVLSAGALPVLLGKDFRLALPWKAVRDTLQYALPVLVGYVAYFLLNRVSILILQRHVPPEELAVFGLAQQLSMIAAIACTSFGMALQPAVYAVEPDRVAPIIRRATRLLTLLMIAVCGGLMLFSREIFTIVAPRGYASGLSLLLTLVVANFTNTFTLMSDTVLLYHRRPKISVAVSILGGGIATLLSLWLIPTYHVAGAAAAICGAFVVRMLVSQWLARRLTGQSHFTLIAASLTTLGLIGAGVSWLATQDLSLMMTGAAKGILVCALLAVLYFIYPKISGPNA